MGDDEIFRFVGEGEALGLVAVYQAADRSARRLESALAAAGLVEAVLFIVPSVSDRGEPVVRVALTPAGAEQLAHELSGNRGSLSRGGGGPPQERDCDGSGGA